MDIMLIVFIGFVGVCLGSFVNALVWRTRQRQLLLDKIGDKKPTVAQRQQLSKLSIVRERSRCGQCDHVLGPMDLVPVVSYLALRGKCRYCKAGIADSPIAELVVAVLAVVSYIAWPYDLINVWTWLAMCVWIVLLALMTALAVYDARWRLLPNRIVAALSVGGAMYVYVQTLASNDWSVIGHAFLGALLLGGLFWVLFQISSGRWIGGGDVKLAPVLGALAGSALQAFLLLFIASLLGTVYALAARVISRKPMERAMRVPFGPFLILAVIMTVLWGGDAIQAYQDWLIGLI